MQLKGICNSCLGCNRLLNNDFGGVYRGHNYMKGRTEADAIEEFKKNGIKVKEIMKNA